jgi:hypothetical protein
VNHDPDGPIYQVYLLRPWRERPASPGQAAVWRVSLEDTRSSRRRGFGSLEEATAYLRARMERGSEGDEETREVKR